ncbi:hypothetical protein SDC9_194529 [bioreactor metagenome]|uniref:Uncharacterized protein n=1 Tax=bioreactor metagenome TaxID=1076179 RepID=A0A645I748_9ZZZZ
MPAGRRSWHPCVPLRRYGKLRGYAWFLPDIASSNAPLSHTVPSVRRYDRIISRSPARYKAKNTAGSMNDIFPYIRVLRTLGRNFPLSMYRLSLSFPPWHIVYKNVLFFTVKLCYSVKDKDDSEMRRKFTNGKYVLKAPVWRHLGARAQEN